MAIYCESSSAVAHQATHAGMGCRPLGGDPDTEVWVERWRPRRVLAGSGQVVESTRGRSIRHDTGVRRSPLILLALVVSTAACGVESSTSGDHEVHRPKTPDELVLAERYRAISRLLGESEAEALCAHATGEAAQTFRCDGDADGPSVPRNLRSLRPDLGELYVYSDLNALVLGAPLRGRQDRLFVRFQEKKERAALWPIDYVLVGVSG